MNFRTTRTRLGAAAVAAVAAGTLAVGVSPASASMSGGYVSGSGTYTDDFGDEGTLSRGNSSNATCLWQRILYAEGKLSYSGIDGIFGSGTEAATKSLQSRWNLTADGLVGPNTFGKADGKLQYVSGSASSGYTLKYNGTHADFTLKRTSTGKYTFYQDGGTRYASYKYRSCS